MKKYFSKIQKIKNSYLLKKRDKLTLSGNKKKKDFQKPKPFTACKANRNSFCKSKFFST